MELPGEFILENEFVVDTHKNLLQGVRIEPRLMKLLCLLVQNRGKMVARESIIETIWNGYGGGEDGLTLAISYLRKSLHDTNKKIIETIPKQGYVFNGRVSMETINNSTPPNIKTVINRRWVAAGILFISALIFTTIIIAGNGRNAGTKKLPASSSAHEARHSQNHKH